MNQERRYRRLLALYPRDHRERHGEEMLGVLLDGKPGWRDGLDLVGGAIALHTRRVFALDGGVRRQDVLAVVSLLGPMLIIAGAGPDLIEMGWHVLHGGPLQAAATPDAPVWATWLVAAVLALGGQRRAAAVASWFGVGGYLAVEPLLSHSFFWAFLDAGWLLLGLFTAIALTWSPGPTRGRELVGRRGILFALAGDAAAAVVLGATPHLSSLFPRHRGLNAEIAQLLPWIDYGAMAVGAYLACLAVKNRRTARRAAFVLALPFLSFAMNEVLRSAVGPALYWVPAVTFAVFYGVPILMVLMGNGILRPVRTRLPS